jgi:acetyl esterase
MKITNKFMQYRFEGGVFDNQVKKYLDKLALIEEVPIEQKTALQVRQETRQDILDNFLGDPDPVKSVENIKIPDSELEIPLRIYTPESEGPFPVILFIHGGGWVVCDLDTHDNICRVLTNRSKSIVVSVDYRLAPEFKYPAAVEDSYAALKWISENIKTYNGDPSKIGICGDSAGGNISAAVALLSRDKGGPGISSQLLIYPVTDASSTNHESYRTFAEGYGLEKSAMEWYIKQYLQNSEDGLESYASPFLADNLEDLPQTCIISAEFDVLRDEAESFAKKLLVAGNDVICIRYNGMIHGFFNQDKILLNAAPYFWDDLANIQKWLFNKST